TPSRRARAPIVACNYHGIQCDNSASAIFRPCRSCLAADTKSGSVSASPGRCSWSGAHRVSAQTTKTRKALGADAGLLGTLDALGHPPGGEGGIRTHGTGLPYA